MKYYESPAFGEWCRRVYGCDMKQIGMLTTIELELFFREVILMPDSNILDIGCGSGHIAAAIANQYQSNVTGIDIDENAIKYAKTTFTNNNSLDFLVADGNDILYENGVFDLIYFIDTLYFTGSIEKLHLLLDKCFNMLKPNGKIVVYWTNHPNKSYDIFEMSTPAAENTQVAKWAIANNISFKAFDLTKAHKLFWFRALEECEAMKSELNLEIPEHFKALYDECVYFTKLCEKGDLFRWFYVFNNSC